MTINPQQRVNEIYGQYFHLAGFMDVRAPIFPLLIKGCQASIRQGKQKGDSLYLFF
jgi:hypothetical protein